jgi:hypothetical protein
MWLWVLLGCFAVITALYVAIRVLQFLTEKEDLEEDEPLDDD